MKDMDTMRVKSRSGRCLILECVLREDIPRPVRIVIDIRQACSSIVVINTAVVEPFEDFVNGSLVLQGVTRLRIISFVRLSTTVLGERITTANAMGGNR
jgi:hypothetical protein